MDADETRAEAILEERRRARHLRAILDLTAALLAQQPMSREEAEALVAATRRQALALFPDKGDVFDLVIAPRYARLIADRVKPQRPTARILPFRRRCR
jgi:hypothetical protein